MADGPIPRTGPAMSELSRIDRGAIAIAQGKVLWVGPAARARASVTLRHGGATRHFPGGVALPGLVDAHTHLVFAGSREREVEQKVRGVSYLEIARSGGGLFQTLRATRTASAASLYEQALDRLRRMVRWGTTSLEVKSGYGLNWKTEQRLLNVIRRLGRIGGPTIVPTFLGGHAYPPEYADRHEEYLRELVTIQLPEVARRRLARYCDVFCEKGFFSASESRRLLRTAQGLGMGVKIHADEFTECGGARLAAELRADSADHLLEAGVEGRKALAKAGVPAVLLPVTPFASLSARRPPGREMVDEGVAVALGTDLSPNSWVEAMPLVLAHAVYGARLTPQEALTAATVNSAHAIGLPDRGRLIPGLPADIVVMDVPSAEQVAYRLGHGPPAAVYLSGQEPRF